MNIPGMFERTNRWAGAAGFTLLEVLAALAILGLASSSVLIVIDRCVNSAADSALRMEAFELVRENMDKILVRDMVDETADFGTSEKYPDISWQTVIEAFTEPAGGQTWLRAVCSAEYVDSTGEKRTIELEHWITPLTDQQAAQLSGQQDLEKLGMEQIIRTDSEAATYANVGVDTIAEWVENGLAKTDDGMFLRHNLDLFIRSKGNPTPEQKAKQAKSIRDLARRLKMEQKELEQDGLSGTVPGAGGKGGSAGLSTGERGKGNAGQIVDPAARRQK
jgi:prepilin-type N-terminal cleavage/methylation domain-containing protein